MNLTYLKDNYRVSYVSEINILSLWCELRLRVTYNNQKKLEFWEFALFSD